MELTVKNSILKDAIENLIKLVPKKPVNPLWASIFIDAEKSRLKLTASSDNAGMNQYIDANVIENGSIAVKAETFANIIRQLPDDDISFTAKENELTISATGNEIEARLPIVLPEYVIDITKIIKESDKETSIKIKYSTFVEMIENVINATNKSDPILAGINISSNGSKLHCLATDRFRIAWRWTSVSAAQNFSVVVNGQQIYDALKAFKDDKDIELVIYKKMLVIQTNDKKAVIALMSNEKYPDIKRIVSSLAKNARNGAELVIPADAFCQSLERLLVVAFKTPSVDIIIDDEGIVTKNATDVGAIREHIKADIVKKGEKEKYNLRFNAVFLIDAFKNTAGRIKAYLLPPHNALLAVTQHSIDLIAPAVQTEAKGGEQTDDGERRDE